MCMVFSRTIAMVWHRNESTRIAMSAVRQNMSVYGWVAVCLHACKTILTPTRKKNIYINTTCWKDHSIRFWPYNFAFSVDISHHEKKGSEKRKIDWFKMSNTLQYATWWWWWWWRYINSKCIEQTSKSKRLAFNYFIEAANCYWVYKVLAGYRRIYLIPFLLNYFSTNEKWVDIRFLLTWNRI